MKLLPAQDELVFVSTSDPEEAAAAIREGCVVLGPGYGAQFLREDSKPSPGWLILGLDPDGHCLVARRETLRMSLVLVSRICALLGVK